MPNLNKLAALLAAFCACAVVFSVAASGQNSATKPTASTAAKPTTGTAASTTGKREFPGLGDPALWKTADELSDEGRRAELTGDSDTAISKFSKAVIIYQYDPELYYYLAMLYFKRQTEDPKVKEANYDAAEICLRRALKLNRDLWYVWKNLGRISFERKGYQAAIYEYQHAIDCNAPASEVSAEISPYMQSAKYQIQKARKAASE
jgi:tetratricopeptide (TPR) repeat protein